MDLVMPGSSEAFVHQLVDSDSFKPVLAKVEERAREAVIAETKKNAGPLIALAIAGGCVGGYLFKGKVGALAAGVVTYWAIRKIMNPGAVEAAMGDGSINS